MTAQNLTRLMGLAGESLVEARWLQPFSKSLLELKRQQSLLGDSLEELRQLIPPEESDDRRTVLLAEASERLAECRERLASQIGEFENRARNADDLNSRLLSRSDRQPYAPLRGRCARLPANGARSGAAVG